MEPGKKEGGNCATLNPQSGCRFDSGTSPPLASDNWVQLLNEYQKDFGKWFIDTDNGKHLIFLGLLHAVDDYYFAMSETGGKVILYSCVVSMENNHLLLQEGCDE